MVVAQMIINRNKKERKKTEQIVMMSKENKVKHTNSCSHCGQYLPWFCVCYLNKCSKE